MFLGRNGKVNQEDIELDTEFVISYLLFLFSRFVSIF